VEEAAAAADWDVTGDMLAVGYRTINPKPYTLNPKP
jgi:predicted PP-loop superfamily ATPase